MTMLKKLLNTDKLLSDFEKKYLHWHIRRLSLKCTKTENKMLKYGMILDYEKYKNNGFDKRQLKLFYEQDKLLIEQANKLAKRYKKSRLTLFGYPANMSDNTYLEDYLKRIDITLPLLNNCGESYSEKQNESNYLMDTKRIEYEIIKNICNNFHLSVKNYSGYITSGGTEGNFYGIRQGIERYPNGIVYFSKTAHYSVMKFLNLSNGIKVFKNVEIKANNDGTINSKQLLEIVRKNWEKNKNPAIIVLTWGTTVFGSTDDINYIVNRLRKDKIEYYIHLDAAFYGGIPHNQNSAPIIQNLEELKLDSISVSLHKYIGCSLVGGVVIRRKSKVKNQYISYIGQEDETFLGSRSILPFSTYYRVNRVLNRSNKNDYVDNIKYFETKLKENKILYSKYSKGNTFILYNVEREVAKKYQLAALSDNTSFHVIIMPFQGKKQIDELINDLKKMYNKEN